MCGICGIVSTDPSTDLTRASIEAMRDTLEHRGPDDAGSYVDTEVALGSRRLAILDLSARGHMPMQSEDQRYCIVYNGEVYNYRDLRDELVAAGHQFRSGTDTEVVLVLYAKYGERMLDRLNGMFAFAIWDRLERSLFIARDRLGVKPLYYHVDGETLRFASEQKALFAAGAPAELDERAWPELIYFRYIAGERTAFRGVRRLLPGHTLTWKRGHLTTRRWWSLADHAKQRPVTASPESWLRETLRSATELRQISDVPVGVLVSGGLDSASLAALLGDTRAEQLNSFTVRFEDPAYDEGAYARRVADRWKLQHHELFLRPESLYDEVRAATWYNDEPLGHGSDAQLYAIAKYARSHVTVLLSGEGSDELLGGYMRYQPLHYATALTVARWLLPAFATSSRFSHRIQKLRRFLELKNTDEWIRYNACDTIPPDVPSVVRALEDVNDYRSAVIDDAHRAYPKDAFRQAMFSDMHTFLQTGLDRGDRMTMGASIECRLPFVDFRLAEGVASLPTSAVARRGVSKPLLRKAMGHMIPRETLQHKKWGFAVPWARYMREVPAIRDVVASIPDVEPMRSSPLPRPWLRQVVTSVLGGDDRWAPFVRQLFMMAVWHDVYFARVRDVRKRATSS